MANAGFDAKESEERAIRPDIPSLRTQESVGTNTAGKGSGGARDTAGHSSGGATSSTATSSNGSVKDSTENRAVGSSDLKNAEENPGASSDSLNFNPEGDGAKRGRFSRAKKRFSSRRAKWVAALGGGAFGGLAILFFVLLGSLGIPNLAQNITTYEFARATRQFGETAESTAEQALAEEATNDATHSALQEAYGSLRDNTWGRLDNYRPSQVINKLGQTNDLKLNFKTSLTGREVFQSIELNGETIPLEQVSGVSKYIPILRDIKSLQNQADFVTKLTPALEGALDGTDYRTLVRVGVASQLRKEAGITLAGLILSKFRNDTDNPNAARLEEEQQKVEDINGTSSVPDNAVTDEIQQAESAAEEAEQEVLNNPKELQQAINNDGVSPQVTSAIKNALTTDFGQKVINAIGGVYGIAVPLCIIYDGSVSRSGPTIDRQINQQQAAYYYVNSVADQQKQGSLNSDPASDSELAAAIHAANSDIQPIDNANAEIRASGGFVNTSSSPSAEAGASSSDYFSLFNALGMSGITADIANSIVGTVCPILTSPEAAAALAGINIGAAIFSFGSSAAAEQAAAQGSKLLISDVTKALFDKLFSTIVEKDGVKIVAKNAVSRARQFIAGQTKVVLATVGATMIAKAIVSSRAGQLNSGMSQSTDLANEADAGGNIAAGEIERAQLFGRPLMNNEVCQSNIADTNFIADQESHQNMYNRYLNLSNSTSLLARTAVMLNQSFSGSIGSSILHFGSTLLKPIASLADMFLGKSFASANCKSVNTDYGNVQFGWSDAEEALIKSNDSYTLLNNQKILDTATNGGEDAIAQTYANCFGYTYNSGGDGSLDPTDPNGDLKLSAAAGQPGSLGTLISNGDIARDSNGNLLDNGSLCSPSNLDQANSTYGPQMVLRWRLAMRYDTTLATESSIGNVSE